MTRLICALVALLALVACTSQPSNSFVPTIDLDSERQLQGGTVVGFQNGAGGHSWLGIPYAAAPTGDLRWRAPRPHAGWRDRLEALKAGSPCIQYGSPLGGVGEAGTRQGSEDCLFLNVYAPRL